MEGVIMDSERFDGLVRSFGQTRSRRQTLRGLAGAGAFVALLAAKPVAAGKAGKSTPPKNAGKKPGNSPPGSGQNGPLGSSPPGHGQIGPTPDPDCYELCQEACEEPCEGPFENCLVDCGDAPEDTCIAACEDDQESCEQQCGVGCIRCERL
jgi:hypothetical protein